MADGTGWLRDNRKWMGVGAGILTLMAVTAGLWGAQWITPREREFDHPAVPDKSMGVSAIIGSDASVDANLIRLLDTHGDTIDTLIPTWYTFTMEGTLSGTPDQKLQQAARQREIPLQPLVRFDESKGTQQPSYLNDTDRRAAVDGILEAAESPGVTGLHLDLRAVGDLIREDGMKAFLREVSDQLQNRGQELVFLIDPTHEGIDLTALTAWSDAIHIPAFRTYKVDEAPGAVASLAWARPVLDRAMKEIQDSKQLILGLPAFGYRWTSGNGGTQTAPEMLPLTEAKRLAKAAIDGDVPRTEMDIPNFRYVEGKREHQVWYEDGLAIRPKMQYAREWNIRGITVWNLEFTDDPYWHTVEAQRRD